MGRRTSHFVVKREYEPAAFSVLSVFKFARLVYVHPTELRLPSGGGYFNGRTAESDFVNHGSNPGPPASQARLRGFISRMARTADISAG